MSSSSLNLCPLCHSPRSRPVSREHPALRKCLSCKAVFNAAYQPEAYSPSYFVEDYRAQYGKTYEEDFDNIYRSACLRMERIEKLRGDGIMGGDLRLLDIGCALGFFLKCAGDRGIKSLQGVEISPYAARYAGETLGIPVINTSFEDSQVEGPFDIITAWYFVEHCRDTASLLERIFALLAPGGIFAFSAPSVFGPQFLFHKGIWGDSHPRDHRLDISPRVIKGHLRQTGYKKIVTCPGGIHPERLLNPRNPFYGPFRRLYSMLSRRLSFSDTLEVYAVK